MKWQTLGLVYLALTTLVFTGLLGFLIPSAIEGGGFYGSTTWFEGRCDVAGRAAVGAHVLTTTVSFAIGLSSEWFLRLAVAPQPEDVRQAHNRRQWLDIGVNSWHNIPSLASSQRGLLWAILLLSSLPLQLFFNASVFATVTATDFNLVMVSEDFLQGGPWQVPGIAAMKYPVINSSDLVSIVSGIQDKAASAGYTRLDTVQCRKVYLGAPDGLQYYRNLIIVIQTTPEGARGWTGRQIWNDNVPLYINNTAARANDEYNADAVNTVWLVDIFCDSTTLGDGEHFNGCQDDFGYKSLTDLPSTFPNPWEFGWVESQGMESTAATFNRDYDNVTVSYCLAEPYVSPCTVEVVNGMLLAVVICVLLKLIAALATYLLLRESNPINCQGDLIRWLLEPQHEDPDTLGLCSREQAWFRNRRNRDPRNVRWLSTAVQWTTPRSKRWWNAVPKVIWLYTYGSATVVLTAAGALLGLGVRTNAMMGQGPLVQAGFGSINNNALLGVDDRYGLIYDVLIANSPQLGLSCCWFWFSALYGRLFQARDWDGFSKAPQKLRVTNPKKTNQEGFYLFGIPLAWALVFNTCSIGLHFVLTRCVYAVPQYVIGLESEDGSEDKAVTKYFVLEFSTQALLIFLCLAVATFGLPVCLSFQRLSTSSVIVGSNSAAISAQCHYESRSQVVGPENGRAVQAVGSEGQQWHFVAPQSTTPVKPFDNSETPKSWLQALEWGVLIEGTDDQEAPGRLGLAPARKLHGKPVTGMFYK